MKKRFLLLLLMLSTIAYSQTDIDREIERANKKLDSTDKKAFTTNLLLNKGFLMGDLLLDYIEFGEHEEDNFILNDKKTFRRIHRGLQKSFVGNNRRKKVQNIDFESIKNRFKKLKNVVPVGIIQAKGEWLNSYEIDENIKAKVKRYSHRKNYDKIFVFNASVLKKRVYTSKVNFEILKEAFFIQNKNQIKSISIDVSDGQGYQTISSKDIITAKYTSIGEKTIAIKFELNDKHFISYSSINVVTLNEEEASQNFNVSSDSSGKSISSGKNALSGGNASLFAGCDNVFDRPVIIVEGFDANNEVSILDLRAKYTFGGIEQAFRNSGHDVIYLNFTRGGDDIRTNARVLSNLILDVNAQKIGNEDLIIIGESMGGLVARYAIRRLLEEGRRTHNISHYISFDAPHRGANVPLAFQSLFRDVESIKLREALNIQASVFRQGNTYLNSKAAKQLLLRHEGVSPHQDFITLQNEFNAMGFPSQGGIRNIAIVNGALDGSINEPELNYNPGDQVISVKSQLSGYYKLNVGAYSNGINSRTLSSFVEIRTGPGILTTNKRSSFNFDAFHYDVTPGGVFDYNLGFDDFEIDVIVFDFSINTFGISQFSFVPLFSSLASTARNNNQGDISRNLNALNANNSIPFDRVFGTNNNTEHLETIGVISNAWRDLFVNELRIPFERNSCNVRGAVATPPSPRINGNRFYMCELSSERLKIDNASGLGDLYNHSWRVTGPRSFTANGDYVTMFKGLPPGRYTVRATRSYDTTQGLSAGSSTSSRVFTVFSQFDRRYGCNEGDDGSPIRKSSDVVSSEDEILNLSDNDIIEEKSILYWPNPIKDVLHVNYEMKSEGDIVISLIPVNHMDAKEIVITNSYRPVGNYEETYYTNTLKEGFYILNIRSATQVIQKMVILE